MNDDQLRRLLSDAVSDVEPQDRLAQIRDYVRSDPKVVPMSRPRSWFAVVGVAAAVAVIGGVAYAAGALQGSNNADDNTPVGPGPSGHHTKAPVTPPTSSAPTTPTSSGTTAPAGTKAYAVYYVGNNPAGKPVLFREFHRGSAASDTSALSVADLGSLPLDPDYTTPWHAGDLVDAAVHSGVIDVTVSSAVHDRPAGMSAAYAHAAIEQVIYTVQAAFQSRMPVQFILAGNPVDQVLGVPTSEPLSQGDATKVCSLMSISSPNNGDQVSRTLTVTGVNNGFEATAVVYLLRDGNGKHLLVTPTMASGWMGHKLYPWTVHLNLSKLPPGQYTLVAQNDDPSGQGHPEVDTRTVIVK
jgi:hypothetical protein